jgi:2-amino-4-hydroxy-6-hydroxymethyldihydropteridine diphosphokinase
LLVFDDERRTDAELTLPHPRLRARRFVLEPLAELWPELRLPPDGAPISVLLRESAGPPLERLPWPAAVRRRWAARIELPEG